MITKFGRRVLLVAAVAGLAVSCAKGVPGSKSKGDDDDSSDTAGDDKTPEEAGVTAAVGDSLQMTGTLALELGLQGAAKPDKVIAFTVIGGKVETNSGGFLSADVDEKGKFKIEVPRVSPLLGKITAATNADGTIDRVKLSELIKKEITDDITDEQIKAYAAEMKAQAERGGITTILVSMKSSGDRFAEAQTFCYIGMPHGDKVMNGLPTKAAKGHTNVGHISLKGDDQCTTELAASSDVFDISDEALTGMAALSDVMKQVRNYWINYDPATGEFYEPTPFFMWLADSAKATNAETTAAGTKFHGWGMYLSATNGPLTFGDICAYKKAARTVKLLPPEGVEIDAGEFYGKITRDRPFDNSKLTAVKEESTRLSCGGGGTGFYGAGKTADDTDLMINWGTGGSVVTDVPKGYFEFMVEDQRLAAFEIGSSSPFDADGNAKVFVPILKLTKDAAGKITKVEVRVTLGGQPVNLDAFKEVVSDVVISLNERTDNGEFDRRYSLLDAAQGDTFAIDTFFADDDGKKAETADVWVMPGSEVPAGAHVATSTAVYYEMFGASYRVEYREGGVMDGNKDGDKQEQGEEQK